MSIRIDGTNTTANPGITGGDADTGLQFGTDEIQFVTGGTNRATVESNGNFTIENGNLVLASGSGIDFSATADGSGTMTSELLDDYEEGTWTPAITDSNQQATWSFNSNSANYTKVGRLVTVGANCFSIGYSGTPSGYLQIRGLPFTKAAGSFPAGSVKAQNIAFGADSYLTVEPIGAGATDTVYLRVSTNNTGGVDLLASNLSNGSAGLTFSITYEAA